MRKVIFFFGIYLSLAYCTNPPTTFIAKDRYRVRIGDDVNLTLLKNDDTKLQGRLGSSVYKTDGPFERCKYGDNDSNLCVQWGQYIVNISIASDNCLTVDSSQPTVPNGELYACFPYEDLEWFGGSERWYQNWPVQTVEIEDKPFLTGYDSSQSVAEPFWFTSNGASIHVSPEVPLFVDSNKRGQNQLCLIARVAEPYNNRDNTRLRYEICVAENAVEAQRQAVGRYFGKPSGIDFTRRPDDVIFREPIYSTWVRFGRDLNQERINNFVQEILDNKFPIGQFEIDDVWEPCYGAYEFDTSRFPNIKNFTDYVHQNGGRVTAWIYPFINQDCNPSYDEAVRNNRFIKSANGDTIMNWWCGTGGAVDLTNPQTATWWVNRVKNLQQTTGLDSFKFDAGETNYLPADPQLTGDPNLIPNIYVSKYVEAASNFKGLMEVRVGRNTQQFPVLVRMLDKDSRFGLDNGLQSLITTLFQMNLAGYPFVLPDMIGGNQYGDRITKELFIRWLQATVFMPVLQFSVVPWDFDTETVEISREFLGLHAAYASMIQSAADKAVEDGTPINTPIWWIAPDDPVALACKDEYLLAGSVLVAPVLEDGARSRDVYLPQGKWFNVREGEIIGPTWLRNFSAPLNILPYFTLVNEK